MTAVSPVQTDSPLRLALPGLLTLVQSPERIAWEPFKPGIRIHRLYGDGLTGPSAALLRFEAGGEVPLHEHTGYEHIFVLSGTQRDSGGTAQAGTLLIHAPGSRHRIVSEEGCIVLAIYERPVRFLEVE